MNKKLLISTLAATLMVLPACSDGETTVETVTETTTVESPKKPNPTDGDSSDRPEKKDSKAAPKTTTSRAGHMGYTGAPTGDPTPINKSIARCAKSSEGLYEQGTTWFTDGTSGWTQYCSNNFNDGPPPVYEPREPYTPPEYEPADPYSPPADNYGSPDGISYPH